MRRFLALIFLMGAVVLAQTPSGTEISNSVTLQYTFHDTIRALVSNTVVTEVESVFDLEVLKTASVDSVSAGDTLVYRIAIRNTGNTPISSYTVIDTLPEHLDILFGDPPANINGRILSWALNSLDIGASSHVDITTIVSEGSPSTFTLSNTAWVKTQDLDAIPSNEVIVEGETLETFEPLLSVNASTDPVTIPGDTLLYTIIYKNDGTGDARFIELVNEFDGQLAFLSGSVNAVYDESAHQITWSLGTLTPGDSGEVSFYGVVSNEVKRGDQLINLASIDCAEGSKDLSSYTTLVRSPEMNITLEASTNTINAGDIFNYNLVVSNTGDTTATNVVLQDSLSEYVTFESANFGGLYDPVGHTITWEIGNVEALNLNPITLSGRNKTGHLAKVMAVEELPTYSIEVKVSDIISNGTAVSNNAVVYSGETGAASVASASTGLGVISLPVLSLGKIADIEVLPGDTVNYELTLSNIGSDIATGVVLIDTLDSRLTLVSISGLYLYDAIEQIITWDLGSMNVYDTEVFSVVAVAPTNLEDGESILNRAWAQSNETGVVLAEATTTNILPLTISLSASPNQIMGNGNSTSELKAAVYSFLGNPAPNGVPVRFYTDAGFISDSISTIETQDGFAFSTLISDTVVDVPITAHLSARADYGIDKYAIDTTEVLFLIGAIEGIITSTTGEPQVGVLVELIGSEDTTLVCACAYTDENGYYLIPIVKDDLYTIRYTLVNDEGEEIINTQEIVIETPDEGSIVTNLNSVSGWVYNGVTGEILMEDSLLVYLTGNPDTTGFNLLKTASNHFVDSTYTDSTGQYFFTNLYPGDYELTSDYNGVESYSNGSLSVNLTTPGAYVVNANMSVRQSPFQIYKEVVQTQAAIGDTIDYSIHMSAIQNWSDSLFIIDRLPVGLEFIDSDLTLPSGFTYDGYDSITNEIRFSGDSITVNDSLEIKFHALISPTAVVGNVENIAYITNRIDTTFSNNNSRSRAKTNLISPYLMVEKSANKRSVEPGDIITYTVRVTNPSKSESVDNLIFDDLLPRGFKLRKGSSHFQGIKISEPITQRSGKNRLSLTYTLSDTLDPQETFELKYRVIVGLNSREGIATNQVQAYGMSLNDYPLQSNVATAEVIVRPGLLSDRGLIIGKVYFDSNKNGIHDNSEKTAHNVELIMETGARIRTDEYGKFSVPDVSAAMHVLRINEKTLPARTLVINDSPDYLGDTQSRIVRVSPGGIAKVSIALDKFAIPGVITGISYYDKNGNSTFDPDEEVQENVRLTLNDSLSIQSDSTGFFTFTNIELGTHTMSLDESSLPGYATLTPSKPDSLNTMIDGWQISIESGDSVNLNIPLRKREMIAAISKQATLEMRTEMITKEFRLIAYKPWTTDIRYGFASGMAELQPEIIAELRRVAELLKWQTQINLDINGHTDNVPIAVGGTFADNTALSQARADAIKEFLTDEAGIGSDRILAIGFGESEPVVSNETSEGRTDNRRVELNFYHAADDDSEYNQLQFRYDINYSGEIEATDVRFHQELPPGFGLKPGSTLFNGDTSVVETAQDSEEVLKLGDWTRQTHQTLDVAIRPDDFEQIKTTGIVSSSLSYLDEDGTAIHTDSLKTQITTVVSTISFNLILEGTQFARGSSSLRNSALPALRKLGDFMTWQPSINIVIEGFTDGEGPETFNIKLSERRAKSVRKFLLDNYDINPSLIEVIGHGPRFPVGDNETREGRQSNRRVEVVVNADVGDATVLEAEVLKEKLVSTLSRPPQPFEMPADSSFQIPSGQESQLTLHLKFPAFAEADSISLSINLINGSYFAESQNVSQAWYSSLDTGLGNFEQKIRIMAPEERVKQQELIVFVDLFKNGESISGLLEKIMKVELK